MTFETLSQVLKTIIATVENTAVAMVKSVKKHTFKVSVTNQVKKVDVSGTVIVGNQKKVEEKIKKLDSTVKSLITTTKVLNKKKYDVEVLNFPQNLEITNLEEVNSEIVKTNSALDKVSQNVQSLHKPLGELKEIRVENQPLKELKKLETELGKITKAIGKIKLSPEINVSPASLPEVIVPPATVTVEKQEIDYDKMANAIVIPEINYNKLAKILSKEMSGMVITGGGGGGTSYAFKDEQGNRGHALVDSYGHILVSSQDITAKYQIADKNDEDDVKYYGFTDTDGAWYILKEDDINKTYRYIKGDSDYPDSWTNRSTLSYDYYHNIF